MNDQVLESVASYFRMLSEPTRLKVLHSISHAEKPVGEIVEETGLSQTNVSRHLNMLWDAGMVSRRKQANNAYYKMSDPALMEICRAASARIASRIDDAGPLREAFIDFYSI
jgi:DNA-binding transcriptional ArsR family regulator